MKKYVFLIVLIVSLLCSCTDFFNNQQTTTTVTFDKDMLNEILEPYMGTEDSLNGRAIQNYTEANLQVSCTAIGYSELEVVNLSSIDSEVVVSFKGVKVGSEVLITADLVVSSETKDLVLYSGSTVVKVELTETLVNLTMLRNGFSVSFDANGGNGTMDSQIFEKDVPQAIKNNTFTKDGYFFMGWAKEPDSTTVMYKNGDIYTIEKEDITLLLYGDH